MGTVYRAVDPRLGRTVAVKLLRGNDPSLGRRFIAEARAQARIQHEHVCRVYEAGEADGEPYIVMQFINGDPLARVRGRLTLEQQVKLIQDVAWAVHEAHRLGMIHRDLKPGNILVEPREDGTWKPYVVDFGLVRQVEEHGQTQTGEVLGTPAYMSPEQANGDVHTLDPRSDVYSLGATLYDVIAGRPPFVSDVPWKVLLMSALEDPPPLGRVKPGVPKAIETIVMKCLEREPARRYDSARALAEDLQRALDGVRLQAKRASWGRRLWKKAVRHKLLSVVLAALVLGALGLGGVWLGAQRRAAEQARLAQQLGEHVKEMELFLRAAYGLPLHDVERERDMVRATLRELERRMGELGTAGEGPGHYAIGVGQLALGDPEQARAHLEKALAAGYASANLEYALGRALGELFRRALEDTRRITDAQERQKKEALLHQELRDPALRHLRAAVGATLEVPAYAEGLIALYEGNSEAAIAKAQAAFAQAPWMYEPKKLEGDALFSEGSKYRHDAAFDYEKMKGYFDRAAVAYQVAAEIGSSDPSIYRAQCELWEKMGWAAFSQGVPPGPPLQSAEEACVRAVRASSKDGGARVQRALVLLARVHVLESNVTQDTLSVVEEALGAAEEGVRALPRDVMAHYAVARALFLRTRLLYRFGREASMAPAIEAYQRVLSLDPGFTWAVNELGDAYLEEGKQAIARGQEAAPQLESALRQYERALVLDSKFLLPVGGRLEAATLRLEGEIARGREAAEPLQALSRAVSQLEQMGSHPWVVALWKARAHRLRGRHDFVLGRDPRASLEAAFEAIRAAAGEFPRDSWLLEELVQCHLLEAEHEGREGRDPSLALERARAVVRKAGELGASLRASFQLLSARLELTALRAAVRRGAGQEERFTAAFESLRPLLSKPGSDSRPYQVAAELHAERADWLASKGRSPEEDLRGGLLRAEEALTRNAHNPGALFAKGRLLLQRARRASVKQSRTEEAQRAREAFDAALRENPLVAREHPHLVREAEALVR
jgi:serine/threonine-protein kinase